MSKPCSQGALLIFTKAPVSGQVKTRLIPYIGSRRATKIYQELLTKTLTTAIKSGVSSIQVWVSGDLEHEYFIPLKRRHELQFFQQKGKDLGERMSNAFDIVLRQYSHAILIGSDCPSLEGSDLVASSNYLKNNTDVVLGPAMDGGYYLIGLNKNDADLFSNIKWGKANVFADTCKNINSLGWKLELLPQRWDVDRAADLLRYFMMKCKNIFL